MSEKLRFLNQELVKLAADQIDKNGIPVHRERKDYEVLINDKTYPFKLLITEAAKIANKNLASDEFPSSDYTRNLFEKITGFKCNKIKTENIIYWTFKHKPGENASEEKIKEIVDLALSLNSAIMQFEYDFQEKSTTRQWNSVMQIEEGDIIFLRGHNKIYAYGKAIKPRKKSDIVLNAGKIMSKNNHGEYISSNYNGCIHFDDHPVFYEDLCDGEQGWGQRVDVDKWLCYNENGIYVNDHDYESGTSQFNVVRKLKQDAALNLMNSLKTKYIENMSFKERTLEILSNNKNVILTGAPGTGKTFLAKEIALSMLFKKHDESDLTEEEKKIFSTHYCFVQFHPSYDYTDFVEGLRADGINGQVNFILRNGLFKEFCKNAIKKGAQDNFDEVYNQFIEDLSENDIQFETPTFKKKFKVEINSNKTCVAIPLTEIGTRMSIPKDMIREYVITGVIKDWKPYTIPIVDYFKKKYTVNSITQNKTNLPYIFVIDEINRGEISKIFGELFFSMDPGYRGKKGKVKTQYSNMQSGETIFDEELGQGWFYVPENVFIIGTMNDIDRSVESMDFAMRRRFTWIEIKTPDRIEMLKEHIPEYEEAAVIKMKAINQIIENIEGLNSSYHIGPAYFLKLKEHEGDFIKLWEYNLEPLIKEYLRGMPNAISDLEKIKKAYFSESNE